MRIQVPPKLVSEVRATLIDFSPLLAAGGTITAATVSVSVYSGVDPAPPTFTAAFSSPIVTVTESAGLVGVIYEVLVYATVGALSLPASYFLAVIPTSP